MRGADAVAVLPGAGGLGDAAGQDRLDAGPVDGGVLGAVAEQAAVGGVERDAAPQGRGEPLELVLQVAVHSDKCRRAGPQVPSPDR